MKLLKIHPELLLHKLYVFLYISNHTIIYEYFYRLTYKPTTNSTMYIPS